MLFIGFALVLGQCLHALVKQTLREFRFPDVMQEARENDILRFFFWQVHPFRENARENRDAH